MSEQIEVRIPTSQLQKLLEAQPDILLKLESMACEKIAEELRRKAEKIGMRGVEDRVKATVDRVIHTVGLATVREEVSACINREQIRTAVREDALNYIKPMLSTMLMEFRAQLVDDVRALARAEFVKVLESVKAL